MLTFWNHVISSLAQISWEHGSLVQRWWEETFGFLVSDVLRGKGGRWAREAWRWSDEVVK
jgi:hypothetical protein